MKYAALFIAIITCMYNRKPVQVHHLYYECEEGIGCSGPVAEWTAQLDLKTALECGEKIYLLPAPVPPNYPDAPKGWKATGLDEGPPGYPCTICGPHGMSATCAANHPTQ